jgi:hypothetical protein
MFEYSRTMYPERLDDLARIDRYRCPATAERGRCELYADHDGPHAVMWQEASPGPHRAGPSWVMTWDATAEATEPAGLKRYPWCCGGWGN